MFEDKRADLPEDKPVPGLYRIFITGIKTMTTLLLA
jgi:hypothetical protein